MKRGINRGLFSGSVLKLIAVITMFIDHVALGLLYRMFYVGMYPAGWNAEKADAFYHLLRHIGRTAFPIFCFLLVEGFFHTKSRLKYALRLGIFAALSELFFDLTLTIWVLPESFAPLEVIRQNPETAASGQNVFFTLLIGLIAIWGIETAKRLFGLQGAKRDNLRLLRIVCTAALSVLIVYAACKTATKLNTDYRYWGVLMIVSLYLFAEDRRLQAFVPYLALCFVLYLFTEVLPIGILHAFPDAVQGVISPWVTEVYALPAFVLMLLYNGKRGFLTGTPAKIAFYAFYPAHLLLIYLVRLIIL